MAFFGITRQGDYNELLHSQPVCVEEPVFGAVADQQYEDAFTTHLLGTSPRAAALQVDGCSHILRKDLLNVLPAVLGRSPTKPEFDVFFTWFDFDSSCVMSHQEFQRSYQALKQSCAKQGEQRIWSSFANKHTDWLRHKRLPYDPQDTLLHNLTESQKIGWHVPKPHPSKDRFFPASSTDVTRREGRSLADYYGMYTLIGLQQ